MISSSDEKPNKYGSLEALADVLHLSDEVLCIICAYWSESLAPPNAANFKEWSCLSDDDLAVHHVEPRLLISGAIAAQRQKDILARGVNAIVNLARRQEADPTPLAEFGISYLCKPIRDEPGAPLLRILPEVIEFIDGHIREKRTVLVHCVAGRSRSAAVVLAFLIAKRNLSLADAYVRLRRCRDVVDPSGFLSQLIDFEKQHRGKSSIDTARPALPPFVPEFDSVRL